MDNYDYMSDNFINNIEENVNESLLRKRKRDPPKLISEKVTKTI